MISILPGFYDNLNKQSSNRFIDVYIKILKLNKIPYKILEFNNSDAFWNDIKKSTLFIARWRGIDNDLHLMQAILPEIERLGVNCLPDFNNSYHCGDKLRLATYYAANSINAPTTKVFFNMDDYINWENDGQFPVIAKLIQGAGAMNVMKLDNKIQARRLAKKMFNGGVKQGLMQETAFGFPKAFWNYLKKFNKTALVDIYLKLHYYFIDKNLKVEKGCLILQEYFPNDYDTRITIIGNRAFGFRRFNRKNDFRASGSGNIDYSLEAIDRSMIDMAFKISDNNGYQTMAYDFIYDKSGKPAVIEMNHTYVDKVVAECPVFWDRTGKKFENKKRYPQYWQLVDALSKPDLIHF